MELGDILTLHNHGPDTWVGSGPRYPWGGLYGGQIVAQGLMAAAQSVEKDLSVHSLHAYFIRRGDASAPIRFEVDRIRDGRSFATRRVVARQSSGAILNMSASFHTGEDGPVRHTRSLPEVAPPEALESETWSQNFERRKVSSDATHTRAWFRVRDSLRDDPLVHACALSFVSDDTPAATMRMAHPDQPESLGVLWMASLDHAIWFHAPLRADCWHLHDFECHAFGNGRGLAIGHIFSQDGTHVATVSQEVLVRRRRG